MAVSDFEIALCCSLVSVHTGCVSSHVISHCALWFMISFVFFPVVVLHFLVIPADPPTYLWRTYATVSLPIHVTPLCFATFQQHYHCIDSIPINICMIEHQCHVRVIEDTYTPQTRRASSVSRHARERKDAHSHKAA